MSWIGYLLCGACIVLHVAQRPCNAANTAEGCLYLYTEQPPEELVCNPYINEELRLECTVQVPLDSDRSAISWFYSESPTALLEEDSGRQLRTNLTEGIRILTMSNNIRNGMRFMRSQLRVLELNDVHVGTYWCRIETEGLMLLPSDPFILQPSANFGNLTQSCPTTRAVSKNENKCAVPVQPSKIPSINTVSSTVPLTSIFNVITSQVRPSQSQSHSGAESQLPPTMSSSSPLMQTSEDERISQTILLRPSVVVSEQPTTDGPSTDNIDTTLKLYIAIGGLGVLVIVILSLLIVTVALYLRKHHWKRNCHNGVPTSNHSIGCPSELASSTSINDYSFWQRRNGSEPTDRDSGWSSQRQSQRSTLPVPQPPTPVLPPSVVPRPLEVSFDHSYEASLTMSRDHDYEDITDFEASDEYIELPPVDVKRNPSYRAYRVQGRLGPGGSFVPAPIVMQNPVACEELCAHDYLVPVSSIDTSNST